MRSKYVHKHSPPCRYASVGKEHLLQINEEIGCFFEDEAAEAEDFKKGLNIKGSLGAMGRKLGNMSKKFSIRKKKTEEPAGERAEEDPPPSPADAPPQLSQPHHHPRRRSSKK